MNYYDFRRTVTMVKILRLGVFQHKQADALNAEYLLMFNFRNRR